MAALGADQRRGARLPLRAWVLPVADERPAVWAAVRAALVITLLIALVVVLVVVLAGEW